MPSSRTLALAALAGGLLAPGPQTGAAQGTSALTLEPYRFQTRAGDTIAVELGTLSVRERRADPGSRRIELKFVRFPSTAESPGPPIVYLAGGPGGSGINAARGDRFRLFMALREVADVIALDQRGTGMSQPDLSCPGDYQYPLDRPGVRERWLELARAAARACLTHLQSTGIDPLGYTTRESAEDLEDLRRALGVESISLWGISYGTHLGLAMIRAHPKRVHRAILAGVEGPDHTFILPGAQQEHLRFLDALAGKHPVRRYAPSLLGLVERVLGDLEERPVRVAVEGRDGGAPDTVMLGRFDAQLRTAMMFHSRNWDVPRFYYDMARGDYSFLAGFMRDYRHFQGVGGLGLLMECASGASGERMRRIEVERQQALLGAARSFPYPDVCAVAYELVPGLRLEDDFRSPIETDVPTLFISGTLDGVTPLANAVEVAEGFRRGAHLIIQGAAHDDDLFLSSPEIVERMLEFLRDGESGAGVIAVPFDFALPARR